MWSLQEQISTAIAETLAGTNPGKKVEIAFPFHYLLDGKKIAGHLIQVARKNTTQNFVRIGIWVNSTLLPPKLPENDQLAQDIYSKTASLCIPPKSWIAFAQSLAESIVSSTQNWSQHTKYLEYLSIKSWQDITLFEDNGSTQLWEKLREWRFQTIQPTWSIIVDDTIFPSWKNYHLKRN
jgi:biotin-(acetyl-CoA carboxylase) ligase